MSEPTIQITEKQLSEQIEAGFMAGAKHALEKLAPQLQAELEEKFAARSTPKQGDAMPRLEFIGLPPGEMVPFGSFDADGETPATVVFKFCPSNSVEPAPTEKDSGAIETLMKVATYLGITEAEERARPGFDPAGPASATIIAAIERRAPPPQQVEPGWVRATDRTPSTDRRVIIIYRSKNGHREQMYARFSGGEWRFTDRPPNRVMLSERVSHWMEPVPLPAAPKEPKP